MSLYPRSSDPAVVRFTRDHAQACRAVLHAEQHRADAREAALADRVRRRGYPKPEFVRLP